MSASSRRPRVLFLCTGSSCRAQMAEGWLRHLTAGRVEALSAGSAAVGVDPLAARVMQEVGIDLAGHASKPLTGFLADPPDLVVAVSAADACPSFPGQVPLLRWPFEDPAALGGSDEEVLAGFRRVRDAIGARVEGWLAEGLPELAADARGQSERRTGGPSSSSGSVARR